MPEIKPYYEHAGITIYHGDCREILPQLPKVDAVITDPPYGINGSSGSINAERGKGLYAGGFADDLESVRRVFVPAVQSALGIAKRGAVTPGIPHAFEYPKPDDIGAILQPNIQSMSKWGRPTWQPILFYGRDPRLGITIQNLTFTSNGRHFDCEHPCPKPDDYMRWIVGKVTLEAETILDPFAGSGTTLVAAKNMGRKAIGIEIEERYCEIAAKRLAQEVFDFGEVINARN